MFILAFFLALSAVTYANNKINEVDGGNADSYTFDRNGQAIIGVSFLLSIFLNFAVKKFFIGVYWWAILAYGIAVFLALFIANDRRINAIKKKKEKLEEVFNILDMITKPRGIGEIDFNNMPFELKFDPLSKKQIARIEFNNIDYKIFENKMIIAQSINALNKFLPYKTWIVEVDLENRFAAFIGNKNNPTIAYYPGSELRPHNWIPVGVNGLGELGWDLGADKKNLGRSQFEYEDTGEVAGTVNMVSAPHGLTVGSSGGGKAIWMDEIVEVI
ncbi:hypothetical protein [Enterococcus sp. AZ180]|uniref:hypothetical protein n=1 Tax=Enterococcus sp. AZ180 TaxID=2774961 RepID=UPI003F1F2435